MRKYYLLLISTIIVACSGGGSGSNSSVSTQPVNNASACHFDVTTVPPASGTYTEAVIITNRGTAALNGWQVTFTLPSNQSISYPWGGNFSGSTGTITVSNPVSYSQTIPANTSIVFGFVAGTSDGTTPATGIPASAFVLGSSQCTM